MSIVHAIIGYGGMGSWHHRSLKEHVSAIQVKGAWDVREEARQKARDAGILAYESLDALLKDPEVQLVTIATPNDFHKDLCIAALRAGKNVICEKPVTLNAQELTEIIDVAKETGLLFTVHHNRRLDRDYRIVQETLKSGLLGRPYFLESKVQGSRRSLHGWRGHKLNGGGMLLDWGIHLIDQMMDLICSPVVAVDAHLLSIYTPEVDDNIKLTLSFENGAVAMLEMATNCLINAPRWHISGTEGTMVIENWECDGRIMRLKADGEMAWEDDIVYTAAGPTRTMAPRPAHTMEELPLPDVKTQWSDYYNNIVDVLENGAAPMVTHEQLLRVMRVVDLLFESAQDGVGKKCHI